MTRHTDRLPPILASSTAYQEVFEAGLRRMLDQPSLGAFILVLANASFDAALHRRFGPALQEAFDHWCGEVDRGADAIAHAPADDTAVFDRIRQVGLDALGATRWRRVGSWQLQFNAVRALRPPRMSDAVVTRIRRPFVRDAFHFNKPFLRPEILWEGGFQGSPLRFLYNKFPFAPGHALLVPQPAAELPQYLDRQRFLMLWDLVAAAGEAVPGIGFGYNAFGAYASVNHLHLQLFVSPGGGYPVEAPEWRHNGGTDRYPLRVGCFDEGSGAWNRIDRLQQDDRAFNLLGRPGRVHVIERARQGSYRHSPWTSGFAWSEVAGGITLFDRQTFDEIDTAALLAEFERLNATDR
jgi:diadenosine tetraphosphate (Ap4A) HIT family hydrolase